MLHVLHFYFCCILTIMLHFPLLPLLLSKSVLNRRREGGPEGGKNDRYDMECTPPKITPGGVNVIKAE